MGHEFEYGEGTECRRCGQPRGWHRPAQDRTGEARASADRGRCDAVRRLYARRAPAPRALAAAR